MVAIETAPGVLVYEADRLRNLLLAHGVIIGALGPDGGAGIQASYDPADGSAVLVLTGVSDADLAPAAAS